MLKSGTIRVEKGRFLHGFEIEAEELSARHWDTNEVHGLFLTEANDGLRISCTFIRQRMRIALILI